MANIKISQLTAAASTVGTQEFEVNESGTSKKVTGTQIKTFVKDGLAPSDLTGVTATAAELNHTSGVTSAIQTQLNAKAALASPALTGVPTAPTASNGTNTTQIATTAYVTANKGAVYYNQNTQPISPPDGSLWYYPDVNGAGIRINGIWRYLYMFETFTALGSDIGLFIGGQGNVDINYITISTTGNATGFGTALSTNELAGVSNGVRAVFGGGQAGYTTSLQYVIFAVANNANSFGNLTVSRARLSGISNATRGVFGGGSTGTNSAVIDYITVATTGNASSFGNLTVARTGVTAGVSNATRGVFGGGNTTTQVATMDYITVATVGNATSFGSLTVARELMAGVSNATRGVFAGGNSAFTPMDYITIATTGNATTFGNLTVGRWGLGGVSNATRGVFGGGYTATSTDSAVLDYITVATTGNATSFGSLTATRRTMGTASATIPT